MYNLGNQENVTNLADEVPYPAGVAMPSPPRLKALLWGIILLLVGSGETQAQAGGTLKWRYGFGKPAQDSLISTSGQERSASTGGAARKFKIPGERAQPAGAGDLIFSYRTGNDLRFSSPALDGQGVLYVGSDDRYLYAINPDGTLKWKFATGMISGAHLQLAMREHCMWARTTTSCMQ